MEVIVQVKPRPIGRDAQAAYDLSPPRLLRTLQEEYGVILRPLHPGSQDAALCTYYSVVISDESLADEVLARLRNSSRVEAAYVKPSDEAPQP